jgi:hypothetical protein
MAKKKVRCAKGYMDDGNGNCVPIPTIENKYATPAPMSMPTGGKRPSLSTYDGSFSVDYNKQGGKISSYYKKGGNVVTGR